MNEYRPKPGDLVATTGWIPGLEFDPLFRPGSKGEVIAIMLHRPTAVVHFPGRPIYAHVPFHRLTLAEEA